MSNRQFNDDGTDYWQDLDGDGLETGQWLLHASANVQPVELRYAKIVSSPTNGEQGRIQYVEFDQYVRHAHTGVLYDEGAEWMDKECTVLRKYPVIRTLKRDGGAVLILHEDNVPTVILDCWDTIADQVAEQLLPKSRKKVEV